MLIPPYHPWIANVQWPFGEFRHFESWKLGVGLFACPKGCMIIPERTIAERTIAEWTIAEKLI
jgi:hypothetical protein